MDTEPDWSAGDVDRWVAGHRADEAIDERRRAHWRRQAGADEATFAGALLDLLEHRRTLALETTSGRRYQGIVEQLGDDVVVLDRGKDLAVVALRCVGRVQVADHRLDAGRRPQATVTLRTVLADAVADRRHVLVYCGAGDGAQGMVTALGADLVVLTQRSGTSVLVNLQAISEVVLTGSG